MTSADAASRAAAKRPQQLSCRHFSFPPPPTSQRPRRAQYDELTAFHSEDYIQMLQGTSPEAAHANPHAYLKYGIELDCPIFHGLFDFCRLYAGASLGRKTGGVERCHAMLVGKDTLRAAGRSRA